jgi:hypothetical protein
LPKTQDSPSDVNSLPFSAAGETDYNLIFPGGGQITIFLYIFCTQIIAFTLAFLI